MLHTKEIGNLGEDIACRFIESKGFQVIERNYLKKWGEIDIVAYTKDRKEECIHFFEVKSVSRPICPTYSDRHDPEENVHALKVIRLKRVIETYLVERGYGLDAIFEFHVLSVFLNRKTHRAQVKWMKNVIL